MINFLTQTDASEWIKQGKILIYPTEGVWGIGCDALNELAVSRIYDLKKRPLDKSFIILCHNIKVMNKFIKPLTDEETNFILSKRGQPVTFLYNYDKENTPNHMQNNSGRLAIRVSTYYHTKTLLESLNKPIISSSANISGSNYLSDIDKIKKDFDYKDVAFYDKPLGDLKKPTPIIDVHSQEVIRE